MAQKRSLIMRAAMLATSATIAPSALAQGMGNEISASRQDETLTTAIDSVLSRNPRVQAELNRIDLAQENLTQARSALFPQISLTGSGGGGYRHSSRRFEDRQQDGSFSYTYDRTTVGIEARHSLYSGGANRAGVSQARFNREAVEADVQGVIQGLILETVISYMDVRAAEAEIEIRKKNVEALRTQLDAANERFRVGEVTRTDVAQAEARLSGALANASSAQANLESARAGYLELVGRLPLTLENPGAFDVGIPDIETAIEVAMTDSPAILSAKANLDAARQSVKIVKGQRRPTLDLVGTAGYQREWIDDALNDENVEVVAQGRLPLYQGGQLASRVRAAKIEEQNAMLQLRATERSLIATISRAWYSVIAADEATRASERQVEAAEIAYNGAEQELAAGLRSTLDVLDQEQDLLEARLGLVRAERQAFIARTELTAAVGGLTADSFDVNIPLSSQGEYPE